MLLYVLLVLLVLVVAILMIPISFQGQGDITDRFSGQIGLDWAGGLIKVHWVVPSQSGSRSTLKMGPWEKSRSQDPSQPRPAKDQSKSQNSRKPGWNTVKTIVDKHVFREILIFLQKVWQSLHLRCEVEGQYGLEDPAATGLMAALIGIFNQSANMRLTPQFVETGLNLHGNVQGRVVPGQIIWDVGRFLLKKPIRKIWWLLIRERNSHNKRR